MTKPTVAWIAMTPVKGVRLHNVDAVELGVKGIPGDRAFFLADDSGRMISGTRLGPLVAVVAEHDAAAGTLSLRFPDGRVVAGEVALGAPEQVGFFGLTLDARPVTGDFSAALSEQCGQPLRLFEMPPQRGGIDRGNEGAATLLGTASLEALRVAAGVDEHVDARRFRMTFGVDGLAPHEEDGWIGCEVRVGDALLRVEGNVGRCAFTTRNADTGVVDFKTLHVLERYRGDLETTEPLPFGVHARVLEPGTVRVGDAVLSGGR
ncbi:MAG TPA: MOSC domain-containing protein [Solirubrobacteraceae bacterium]|jgi:uncharacterized protein YcbX|nr:MOSC domain-containing protein [Solirubrobacteraceae bacterium]